MPKKIEEKLKKEADKKGLKGVDKARYVYGTIENKTKEKPKKK